jgi:mono/diheme cytochrome c family protein
MRLTRVECDAAMYGRTATLLFAIALAGLAGGIAIHARGASQTHATDQPHSAEERARLLAKGKELFIARCSRCHGENGDKPLKTGVPLSE